VVNQTLMDLHTECGHTLLTTLDIPDFYCLIARDHHKEHFDTTNELLVIIRMANHACRKIGIGMAEDRSLPLVTLLETGLLGMSEVRLAELQVTLEDSLPLSDVR
jgi:hypothetical protein